MRGFLRKIKGKHIVLLLLALWLIFCFFAYKRVDTTFNVAVDTERVKFTTTDKNNSRLNFYGAEIASLDSIIFKDFDGQFDLASNVNVTIERISNGPLSIIIEGDTNKDLGSLRNAENGSIKYRPKGFFEIFIPNVQEVVNEGQNFIFPINGNVEVGRSVDIEVLNESTSVLNNGKVFLTGTSYFGNDYFEAGVKELYLGDKLEFEEQLSKAFGFVLVDENYGMKAAYRIKAKKGKIIKPGPRDDKAYYTISATWFDMITKDKFINTISFGIVVIFTILLPAIDLFSNKKN